MGLKPHPSLEIQHLAVLARSLKPCAIRLAPHAGCPTHYATSLKHWAQPRVLSHMRYAICYTQVNATARDSGQKDYSYLEVNVTATTRDSGQKGYSYLEVNAATRDSRQKGYSYLELNATARDSGQKGYSYCAVAIASNSP